MLKSAFVYFKNCPLSPSVTLLLAVVLGLLSFALKLQADDKKPLVITLENHKFQPTEVHFPSGKATTILVKNLDATAEEFESGALQIEKVIPAKGEGLIHIRPTQHGHYTFVGEYHEKIARGVLVAD